MIFGISGKSSMTYFNPCFRLICLDFFVDIRVALRWSKWSMTGVWLQIPKRLLAPLQSTYPKPLILYVTDLLLAKLRAYGVGEEAIVFLHSYLSGRKQRVKVNGVFSDWLPVYCGVPQGSLLGPLLFIVFINDLNFSVQLYSLRLYADDTTAYASNTDISALELSLNKDLENLSSWFASNYLSVNSKKTQAMILGKHSHEPALHIGDRNKWLPEYSWCLYRR